MIETFKRRNIENYHPTLIIADEAHKSAFTKVFQNYPDAFIIGATATPVGKHIPQIYTNIVQTIDTPHLIEQGFLSPCKAFQMQDDFSDLTIKGGEYTDESQYAHYNKPKLYKGVVDKWQQLATNKKTLVFNVNIKHAEEMNREFKEAGIISEVVTSNTTSEERKRILTAFKQGHVTVLNNCGILTTGYDEPSIECVIMNRKTKSLPLWLQCCGRGSRIYQGKSQFIILDFGMNHHEHGMWEEPREWTLNQKKPKKKQEQPPSVKECPSCTALVFAAARICNHCGFEFAIAEPELKEGVMVEVKPTAPEHLKGKKIAELDIPELLELERSKKYKPSFIWRVIRSKGEVAIKQYAALKGYSSGWIYRQRIQSTDSNFTNFTIR